MLWKEANDSRAWSVSAYHLALLANMVAGYMWANSTPDERPAKPPQIPLPGQTNSDNTEAIPHTVAGQQVAVMTIEKFNQAHNYYQGQQQ